MYSPEQGAQLVSTARKVVESAFSSQGHQPADEFKEQFSTKQGVFTTLYTEHNELRGCIGFPEAQYALHEGLVKSAYAAAFNDPRFPPLSQGELTKVRIEVSVLTVPEKLEVSDPKEYLQQVTIGKDGLIIEGPDGSGLLLPQVAKEWGWSTEEFLEHTCLKAGLPQDAWLDSSNKVYTFQAQIFAETEDGEITEKKD